MSAGWIEFGAICGLVALPVALVALWLVIATGGDSVSSYEQQ